MHPGREVQFPHQHHGPASIRREIIPDRARPKLLRTLRRVRLTAILDWHCQSITCRGTSALHGPRPLGMGSRSGHKAYFKEEDEMNSEDALEDARAQTPVALVVQTWCRLPLRSWGTQFTLWSSSSWAATALTGLPGLRVHR